MLILAMRSGWVFVLRGLLGILFGIVTLLFPKQTITPLVLLFGAYAVVDGLFALMYALGSSPSRRAWFVFFEGAAGLFAGIGALLWTEVAANILLYLIAGWAILTGGLEIAATRWLRQEGVSEFLLRLCGFSSMGLGIVMLALPAVNLTELIWLVGSYALIFGGLLVWFGLQLRQCSVSRPASSAPCAQSAADRSERDVVAARR